jgi:hypothetical protein
MIWRGCEAPRPLTSLMNLPEPHESHELHEERPERPQHRAFRPILMRIFVSARGRCGAKLRRVPKDLMPSASEASHAGETRWNGRARRRDRRSTKMAVISHYFKRYRQVTTTRCCDPSGHGSWSPGSQRQYSPTGGG